jgi:hypothetical protein
MWDSWKTKRHWGRFLVFLATHPTDCSTSTSIIIRGWYNRPAVASVILDSVALHPTKGKKTLGMF